MAHRKTAKRSKARNMLRLADLEQRRMRFLTRLARPVRKNHTVTPSTNLSGGTVPNHVLHLTGRSSSVPVLSRTEESSAVYDQCAIGRRQAPRL